MCKGYLKNLEPALETTLETFAKLRISCSSLGKN